MLRVRKYRISIKFVFFEDGGGIERDEKFISKYNKIISFINLYGIINCVVYDIECKGNLVFTIILYVIILVGNRYGWYLFYLIGLFL